MSPSVGDRVDPGDHVCAPMGSGYGQPSGRVDYVPAAPPGGQRVLIYTDHPPPSRAMTCLVRRVAREATP